MRPVEPGLCLFYFQRNNDKFVWIMRDMVGLCLWYFWRPKF